MYNPSKGIAIILDLQEPFENLMKLKNDDEEWGLIRGSDKQPERKHEALTEDDMRGFPHASDIWYHDWISSARGSDISAISAILVPVVSGQSLKIVNWAVSNKIYGTSSPGPWPGEVFDFERSETGFAILGDTYGRNVARFLVQHKKHLGEDREVAAIRVWESPSPSGGVVSMMFVLSHADGSTPPAHHTDDDDDDIIGYSNEGDASSGRPSPAQ